MPFRSKSQVRACFAKNDPKWDCHKFAHETDDIKKLPEKKKKRSFKEYVEAKEADLLEAKKEKMSKAHAEAPKNPSAEAQKAVKKIPFSVKDADNQSLKTK